jgi:hypothetical protein
MANLFIGMGGSGVKTLREIQKKQNADEAQNNHFLFIDTDSREFVGMNPDDYLDLGEANILYFWDRTSSSTSNLRKDMDSWFDPACKSILTNAPLKEGASAIRPQGRASIAEKNKEFLAIVSNKVNNLVSLVKKDKISQIDIYIVLSCAGGTGSSIFLDLSYAINNIIVSNDIAQKGVHYMPWVILYMPDGFIQLYDQQEDLKKRYRTNVFATWKEIDACLRDYYSSGKGRTHFSDWAIGADAINAQNFSFQPFANAVLIDYQNEKGKQISIKNNQLYKNVAQYLRFITVSGGKFRSTFNQSITNSAKESIDKNENWVKQYTTAGYSEIRGGSFLFDEYVQLELKKALIKGLVGAEENERSVLIEVVDDILGKYLFKRIEADGFSNDRYKNKSEDSVPNPHKIVENSLAKIFTSYDNLTICENKEEVLDAADKIREQFKSVSDSIGNNFRDDFKSAEFHVEKSIKAFLTELYSELAEKIITHGIKYSQSILDLLDKEIDECFNRYDREFQELSAKNVVGSDGIMNKDILAQIELSYSKIKNGEGAPLIMGKNEWYKTQLIDFTDKIKAYVRYRAEEVLLEIKRKICFDIALGPNGDIKSRQRVREMANSLDSKLDIDISKEDSRLIEKFRDFKDDPLTKIVPDVSRYVDHFGDSGVNFFKKLYESDCGLVFNSDVTGNSLARRRTDDISPDVKTIEDLLRIVIQKDLITACLDDSLSVEAFIKKFIELLGTRLETQILKSELPKYGEISSRKLSKWVEICPEDFERYKSNFMDNASLFCSINTSNIVGESLWVFSADNQKLCDEILIHNKSNASVPTYEHGLINDDVVAYIRMASNISFDDYSNYPHYLQHYSRSMMNAGDVFPHLDVRFKNEMKKYPSSIEDNKILAEYLKSQSNKVDDDQNKNDDQFKNMFNVYAKLVFLSNFYELIKANEIRLSYFVDPAKNGINNAIEIPIQKTIASNNIQFNFYKVKPSNWHTVSIIDGLCTFLQYSKETLLQDFRNSVYNRVENNLWKDLTDYRSCVDDQIRIIKIVKLKEKSLSAMIQNQIVSAINLYTQHVKEIIPVEEQAALMKIIAEVKLELESI